MAAINVEKLSLKELVALNWKIRRAIMQARARERAEVKKKLAELAAANGFSISELLGRRVTSKGSIAKYANPDDSGDTWTGRGRKPDWLNARLRKGAKLQDFAL